MKQAIHSNATFSSSQSNGKEKLILFVIGLIGVAGLVFVLNAKSGKSAFSDAGASQDKVELVAGN